MHAATRGGSEVSELPYKRSSSASSAVAGGIISDSLLRVQSAISHGVTDKLGVPVPTCPAQCPPRATLTRRKPSPAPAPAQRQPPSRTPAGHRVPGRRSSVAQTCRGRVAPPRVGGDHGRGPRTEPTAQDPALTPLSLHCQLPPPPKGPAPLSAQQGH